MRAVSGIIAMIVAGSLWLATAPAAQAAHSQEAMFMDTVGLVTDPADTLVALRRLGVDRVRLFIGWYRVAPQSGSYRRPKHFKAVDPKAYPAANWAPLDRAIEQAKAAGIELDVDLGGGAPLWATGPNPPRDGKRHPNWEPSASEYGAFVRAVATRYSGNYNPKTGKRDPGNRNDLPSVHFWSIWNEPDYGPSLAPQGLPGNLLVEHSPWMYRNLLDAAWTALHQTRGHSTDKILFGELAPRGFPSPDHPTWTWGVFSGMKPLTFMRALYCVDQHYHQLRGLAASLRGCPATAAGSRAFRSRHPALFQATGVADHPYSRWYPPNVEQFWDPDYSTLAEMGVFERGLDRLQRTYGSTRQFPIWNTEYGYITSPPKRPNRKDRNPWVSPATAAYYMNWAEYISWRDPRIQSTMQYLLSDPYPPNFSNDFGGFASGLVAFNGRQKPTYAAYRLPLYMPVTKGVRGTSLEVWGCARPAPTAAGDTGNPQVVTIQLQTGGRGPWKNVQTVSVTDPHGYFDARVAFPVSGNVRLTWSYPPVDAYSRPTPVYSRTQQITIR